VEPEGTTFGGAVIYRRPVGAGFTIIVEARPGLSERAVGSSSFDDTLSMYPDLQIASSSVLGNGSDEVCDYRFPNAGGIPAIPEANLDSAGIAAVNDFACRFRDGLDDPHGRGANDGCVLFDNGSFGFARMQSTIQFCAAVDRIIEFPPGDTLLAVRLRDVDENIGPTAYIVLRVGL
jgi:hypothetical protein